MARARKPVPLRTGNVRCAIYTRKSTEEGLDQEFNSLDAQREACEAYILSQRHEGWTLVQERYDDGGFSGGSMERPSLKRLLADVQAGKVDVIVVYKVDRLTRALSDFAKIVEILDARGASFVSITQAFNTTTSMGRLTLNVLLSFAQFEREVTGERIRDKIAASKKKGMWMGGPVPLGYEVRDRKLIVNETEAELVRHIMRRYLVLPSVKALVEELAADGHRTKLQVRASGPHRGGCPFRRGTLYHLLANRIYLGEIVHHGVAHPGEHPAIVAQELWQQVQERLVARGPGMVTGRSGERRSLLVGLLHDGLGRAMTPSHATKGGRRYRYYVTRDPSMDEPAWRVSAWDVERLIDERMRTLLRDRTRIIRLAVTVDPRRAGQTADAAQRIANEPSVLAQAGALGIERIALHEDRLDIIIREGDLLRRCGIEAEEHHGQTSISIAVERVRRGHEIRLVIPGPDDAPPLIHQTDPKLAALVSEAIDLREAVLSRPNTSFAGIAADLGKCRKHMARLLPIAWLAPDIVKAIAQGTQPVELTAKRLLAMELPTDWTEQRKQLGFV
ncbi:recombinase family protein [Sphingomonas profundi]|uniref:recombinase family protein n=1 Tax=Alterirhizorhabdus profundi TaxID=2681549 RepID=UPI0012E85541|nr:recombinase family protein [Sphingomonas profundi]